MPAVKLKSLPDPSRQALIDALADLASARKRLASHTAATRKCWSAITAAQSNIATAEKGIAKARIDAVGIIADIAVDGDDIMTPPPNIVALAKAAHTDAVEALDNLRAAREQLRRTLPDFEADVRSADNAVDSAISEILREPAQRLINELRDLIARAQPLRERLLALGQAHADRVVDWHGRKPIEPQLDAARKIVLVHSLEVLTVTDEPWKTARQRLRDDPDADIDDLLALPASPPRSPAA